MIAGGGMPAEDGRADLRSWAIWKLEVQHHDVGPLLGRGGDRIQAGGCLGDNEPIVVDNSDRIPCRTSR